MPSGPKKRRKAAAAAAAAAAAKKKEDEEEEEEEEEEQVRSISSTTPLPPQQQGKDLGQNKEMERSESAKEESPFSVIPVSEAKDASSEFVHHSKEEEEEEEEEKEKERSAEVFLQKLGSDSEAAGAHLAEENEEASEDNDVGLEPVEAKEEAGVSNLEEDISAVTEIVPLEKPSGGEHEKAVEASENSVAEINKTDLTMLQTDSVPIAPVSEEEVEAGEVLVSDPADSGLSEGEESREMLNMGTVIETSVTGASSSAPLLEHRSWGVWNCCGLLDVFKGSQR